jgi:hypothetical protein
MSARRFTVGHPCAPTIKLPSRTAGHSGGRRTSHGTDQPPRSSGGSRRCWARRLFEALRSAESPPTPPPTLEPIPGATPSPSPSVDARPRWPLSGKLLKDEGKARHAAVAVKVPDNRREHPQRGIDKADIVFVELEGYRDASGYGGTRLVPVFHQGPIESTCGPLDSAGAESLIATGGGGATDNVLVIKAKQHYAKCRSPRGRG